MSASHDAAQIASTTSALLGALQSALTAPTLERGAVADLVRAVDRSTDALKRAVARVLSAPAPGVPAREGSAPPRSGD